MDTIPEITVRTLFNVISCDGERKLYTQSKSPVIYICENTFIDTYSDKETIWDIISDVNPFDKILCSKKEQYLVNLN